MKRKDGLPNKNAKIKYNEWLEKYMTPTKREEINAKRRLKRKNKPKKVMVGNKVVKSWDALMDTYTL